IIKRSEPTSTPDRPGRLEGELQRPFERWIRRFLGFQAQSGPRLPGATGRAVERAADESEFAKIMREIRERDRRGGGPPQAFGGLVGGVGVVPGRQGLAVRFMEGLRTMRGEFAFQNRPAASFTTGSDLYRQAQLAAVSV